MEPQIFRGGFSPSGRGAVSSVAPVLVVLRGAAGRCRLPSAWWPSRAGALSPRIRRDRSSSDQGSHKRVSKVVPTAPHGVRSVIGSRRSSAVGRSMFYMLRPAAPAGAVCANNLRESGGSPHAASAEYVAVQRDRHDEGGLYSVLSDRGRVLHLGQAYT